MVAEQAILPLKLAGKRYREATEKCTYNSHFFLLMEEAIFRVSKTRSGTCTQNSQLLSQNADTFPIGTILPYVGDFHKIPNGWKLCDGTDGTPDFTGRFLEGATTNVGQFKRCFDKSLSIENLVVIPKLVSKTYHAYPYPQMKNLHKHNSLLLPLE